MKWIVYRTTCLINNYEYIGWHKTENPDIFDGYLGNAVTSKNNYEILKYPKYPFHFAVIKYGPQNFKRETLFIYDTEKEATDKESELVNLDYIRRYDTYNVALGGSCNPNPPKKVYLFNVLGMLLNSYDSSELAAKLLEGDPNNLRFAIRNKGSFKEYLWSYEPKIDVKLYNFKIKNKYYLYNLFGEFIQEFNLAKDICDYLETDTGNVSRAVKNNYKIKGYYISTEKLDKYIINISPRNTQKLNLYSLDGVYIASYKTVAEAKKKTGLKLCSVSLAVKNNKLCNGFLWTRDDNPPMQIESYVNPFAKKAVNCYSLDGILLESFPSVLEADKKYPGCKGVLKGKNKTAHNLIFKYK